MTESSAKNKYNYWPMLALILAGEGIFFLPFVLIRVFRHTFLEVFELTNFQLGAAFSAYGIVAMLSYFFGGPLADYFSSKKLMVTALLLTSLGGIVLGLLPTYEELSILYAFWGLTTILLFWSAMIKSTRLWGGKNSQGKAFGYLDAGRGLAAALLGTAIVLIYEKLPLSHTEAMSKEERFQMIIYIVAIITALIGLIVWLLIPKDKPDKNTRTGSFYAISGIRLLIKKPTVWLQAIIIMCAYIGYKVTDDFSLYASEVLNFSDVESAKIGTMALYIRPIVGVIAGLSFDKTNGLSVIKLGFVLTIIGALSIATGIIPLKSIGVHITAIITTGLGVYTLRSIYFSIMEKGNIPIAYTGTAVGLVSVIGYTPDIFAGPIMGLLLDQSPGLQGHQNVFYMLCIFSLIGLLSTVLYQKTIDQST